VREEIVNASTQGSATCDEVAAALIASIECQIDATCEDLVAQADCTEELEAELALENAGGGPCLNGNPPVTVPAEWTCPGAFFGAGDGCDCGCGALDPDCTPAAGGGAGGCEEPACRQDSCAFCYESSEDAASGTAVVCSIAARFCEKSQECTGQADAACTETVQGQLDASANQGSAACTEMSTTLLASLTCQANASCADLASGAACADEQAAVNALVDDGAGPCLNGDAPVLIPIEWICPSAFFAIDDGCDCGCGAIDPDCNGGGCDDAGCRENACEFCYESTQAATDGQSVDC
jgi:hypothetical protein